MAISGIDIQFLDGIDTERNSMKENVIDTVLNGFDNDIIDDINSIINGDDLEGINGINTSSDEERLHTYLVRTKRVADRYPQAINGYQKPQLFSQMLGFVLKNWDNGNRELALENMAREEERLIANKSINIGFADDDDEITFGDVDSPEDYEYIGSVMTDLGKVKASKTKNTKKGFFNNVKKLNTAIKTTAKKATQKVATATKQATKKVATAVKKATKKLVKLVIKYNPITLVTRAVILMVCSLNMFKMAERLYPATKSENEALKLGITSTQWSKSKECYNTLVKSFTKIGGSESKLKTYLEKGSKKVWKGTDSFDKNILKEQALKNRSQISKMYDEDEKELKSKGATASDDPNVTYSEVKETTVQGLLGLIDNGYITLEGLGVVATATIASGTASAGGILTGIIAKLKNIFANGTVKETIKTVASNVKNKVVEKAKDTVTVAKENVKEAITNTQSKIAMTYTAESFPLAKGMKGEYTKTLQSKLGVTADGYFGDDTESALKNLYGVTTCSQEMFTKITGNNSNKKGMTLTEKSKKVIKYGAIALGVVGGGLLLYKAFSKRGKTSSSAKGLSGVGRRKRRKTKQLRAKMKVLNLQ
ncbi:MAG: hypothetical protein MJ197_03590 [Bacteroidales bacterium]|nr:hypothetical protein [Bacteroidales bacterium]